MKSFLDQIVLIGQQCPDCRQTFGFDRRNSKTLEEAAEAYVNGNACTTCVLPPDAPPVKAQPVEVQPDAPADAEAPAGIQYGPEHVA